MATIFSETFTAANGTTWTSHNADWEVYTAGAGSAATVQSNAGRERMTVGGYSASVFAFHRDSAHTDIRVFFTLVADADESEMYPQLRVRQTDDDDGSQSHTCYVLDMQTPWDVIAIRKRLSNVDSDIVGSTAFSFTGGTTYYGIFEATGSTTTTLKVWLRTGSWHDPDVDSPTITGSDSTSAITSGGVSFEVFGGNAATNQDAIWDSITADDLVVVVPDTSLVPFQRSRFHRHLLVR